VTTEQLDELKAQIARQHELLAYYAPAYMQPEIAALWTDLCALIGIEAEALAMARARECQSDLFAELWGPV
jgi:hypothetical protein